MFLKPIMENNYFPNNNPPFLGLQSSDPSRSTMNHRGTNEESDVVSFGPTLPAGSESRSLVGEVKEVGNKNKKGENNDNNSNKVAKKVKRARYAFETRSQVDILDDGYRWRKYGQKAVKNNKFPRSYYRCTHQGCNVKKQVQRLTKDEGVVVTTYEGMHSHPIQKSTDNFEHILTQMQIYNSF